MNKALLLFLLPFAAFSQQKTAIIKGRIPELSDLEVQLEGANHSKTTVSFDKNGNFSFHASVDSGYFCLDKNFYFYLGPGMLLNVNGKLNNLSFSGKGQAENSILSEIGSLTAKFFPQDGLHLHTRFNSMNPDDFIDLCSKFKEEAYLCLNKEAGEHFKASQRRHIDYLVKYFTYEYLQRYGIAPEKEAEYFKIAQNLKPGTELTDVLPALQAMQVAKLPPAKIAELQALIWQDFNPDDDVLYSFSPYYKKLVFKRIENARTAELIRSPYLRNLNPNELRKDIIKREFKDGPVKDELLYQSMLNLLSGSVDDERLFKDYQNSATDSVYKRDIHKRFEILQKVTPGNQAPGFSFRDNQNSLVSSESLKGSYLFVNIWAMWLNSSVLELSHLKAIEKKYQNFNIRFVNISVDSRWSRERWIKFTRAEHPGGLHLLADRDLKSEFVEAFAIHTFPRYVLIDPSGKIISANAPRPSNPKLQEMLDNLLLNNLSTCATCTPKAH